MKYLSYSLTTTAWYSCYVTFIHLYVSSISVAEIKRYYFTYLNVNATVQIGIDLLFLLV